MRWIGLLSPAIALPLVAGCGAEVPTEGADSGEESAVIAPAAACSPDKVREVTAAATAAKPEVVLDCSLTLPANAAPISKRVVIQGSAGSGVTLDCAGAHIKPTFPGAPSLFIRSVLKPDGTWDRPQAVTVRGCTVEGSVRVTGMGVNGEAAAVRESSHQAGHTARAQAAAPTNIALSQVHIIGSGTIPLYVSPGGTRVSLTDSRITGTSASVAIYLDAESARNVIRNNVISVSTSGREQIAVDGSAYNEIVANHFGSLSNGGIYLYRNCGEGGTVRHQSPVHNGIVANVFYYNHYLGWNPSVWVGSRNGWRSYCEDDAGYPFGSSVSNLDYAKYNVLAQNQIYKLSTDLMLRFGSEPNTLVDNETVTQEHPVVPGCVLHLFDGRSVYVKDGASFVTRTSKTDEATGVRYDCSNGAAKVTKGLPLQRATFGCAVSGNNAGCTASVTCPPRTRLVGLKAACNLESGSVSDAELAATAFDALRVATPSDIASDGECRVGSQGIATGSVDMTPQLGTAGALAASCHERDSNGGDCAVKGQALCL